MMKRMANAKTSTQPQSGKPAMFACACACAAGSIHIIRTLSLSLGVLLVVVLFGLLISLALLLSKQAADGNLS